jgi:hypothetical protein
VGIHGVVGDMGVAIVITTLLVRTALVPLMRRQMVSMRKMQAIAPEVKEIQRRYKSDRVKSQQATMALYKERGDQPGRLPDGAAADPADPADVPGRPRRPAAADLTESLKVFGFQVVPLTCPPPHLVDAAATRPAVRAMHRLRRSRGWVACTPAASRASFPCPFSLPLIGCRHLAVRARLHGAAAHRVAAGPAAAQPGYRARPAGPHAALAVALAAAHHRPVRQRHPGGVFIYLIVSTLYQIIQQFLTTGWGGMFPLFGRTPAFAVDHQPALPGRPCPRRPYPPSRPAGAPARPNPEKSSLDRTASANATIRQRGRQGRRGRRR